VEASESWWRRAWREVTATAVATWSHVAAVAVYLWNLWRRRQLAGKAVVAQESLGQSLLDANLGDAQLREQLASLDQAAATSAKKDKQAARQRRQLLQQLAEPALAEAAVPVAVEGPWQDAHAARVAVEQQQEQLGMRRQALRSAGWRRIAAGYGT